MEVPPCSCQTHLDTGAVDTGHLHLFDGCSPAPQPPMKKIKLKHLFLVALVVVLGPACSSDEDDFAQMTPCAEVTTYHDRAGICPADDPLVSFLAPLDDERPLLLHEEGLVSHAVLPDCSVLELTIDEALVVYQPPGQGEQAASLLLRLNGVEETVTLEELRQDSFELKEDYLALQVVRVSATEVSGAVFVRYPHASTSPRCPDPQDWIIDTVITAPEDRQDWTPEEDVDEETTTFQQLVGTPELINLERFIENLHGGGITNYALTIQGRYTGDVSITDAESFYAPYPQDVEEGSRITERAKAVVQRFYLEAPGWNVVNHLTVEALDWGERYLANVGQRLFGREIGLLLTWSDPASGTVVYQVEDTVGLVRWETDHRWYVDTERISRRVIPLPENRLWLGEEPPPGVTIPEGMISSGEVSFESLSEEEFWSMVNEPATEEEGGEDAEGEGDTDGDGGETDDG